MKGYGVRRQAKRDAAFVSKGKRRRASLAAALHNFVPPLSVTAFEPGNKSD
jgi:hypothetical protein